MGNDSSAPAPDPEKAGTGDPQRAPDADDPHKVEKLAKAGRDRDPDAGTD